MSVSARSPISRLFLAVLTAQVACVAAPGEEAIPVHPEDPIAALMKQLGDGDFDAREAACEKLKGLGEKARRYLEAAMKDADPEVSHSAKVLLKIINRATIQITVNGPDGKPLAEANVVLNLYRMSNGRMMPSRQAVSAKTDAAGMAVFEDLEPETYYVNLGVQAQGFLPANLSRQNQRLSVGVNKFDLACSKGGTLRGVLHGENGKPLAGKRVVVCHVHMQRWKKQANFAQMLAGQRGAETDEQGAFQFDSLHPMEYFLAVVEGDKVVFTSNNFKAVNGETVDAGTLATGIKDAAPVQAAKAEAPKADPLKEVPKAIAIPAVQVEAVKEAQAAPAAAEDLKVEAAPAK